MKIVYSTCIKQAISTLKKQQKINQLSHLMNKIKIQKRDKIQFLQSLIQEGTIENYFQQKNIHQLQMEDIYFYLSKRNIFTILPYFARKQMIRNNNLDVYSKFFTAKELGTLDDPISQKHLILAFNQRCLDLNQQQFLYCLEKISKFNEPEQILDLNYVEQKIQSFYGIFYVQSIYYLTQFIDSVQVDIQKLADAVERQKLKSKHLYFLKQMISSLKFQEKDLVNKINSLAKRVIQQCQYEQSPNALDLLQYYPNLINFIDIQKLNPNQYVKYLQSNPEQLQIHQIPQNIIHLANYSEFHRICHQRVNSSLDTPRSLVDNMKLYFTHDLQCIAGLLRFLQQANIEQPQIWMNTQLRISHQLHLNNEKKYSQTLSKYSIISILKILGFLALKKQGSIEFWKSSFFFFYKFLQDNQKIKQMDAKDHKNFIIYIYQIFTHKMPKQAITQKVKQLTLLAFTIHKWRLKELLPLTYSLVSTKIGDDQIWLGLQKKILSMNLQHIEDQLSRQRLVRILQNFNSMGRGSYKFWGQIKYYLKAEERQALLSYFKNQRSAIHSYLKI